MDPKKHVMLPCLHSIIGSDLLFSPLIVAFTAATVIRTHDEPKKRNYPLSSQTTFACDYCAPL